MAKFNQYFYDKMHKNIVGKYWGEIMNKYGKNHGKNEKKTRVRNETMGYNK